MSVTIPASVAWSVRRVLAVALFAVLAASARPSAASQLQPGAVPAAPEDREADVVRAATVMLGGEPVVQVPTGMGLYTPQFRADRISQRLLDIVRDRSLDAVPVTVTEAGDSSELRVGSRLLMVITQNDARSMGTTRATLADQYAREFEIAIRAERLRYDPSVLVRSVIYSVLATLALFAVIWLIRRFTRALAAASLRERGRRAVTVLHAEVISADAVGNAIQAAIRSARFLLIAVALELYLAFVLGRFPWTRSVSVRLLDYLIAPIRAVVVAFVDYLPNLIFVLIIGAVVYAAIRIMGLVFKQIRQGRIVFASFPAEWADPTNKIFRVLVIAFGVVVAFPYLPASSSPAFAGVSVFIGLLLSLASSSALSNSIAGLVLTYTGAFRIGDRVKVGESYGDILETSLLATRVRTIKNEDVTIPNGLVLGSSVINYSRAAGTLGLILHTTVTIGYATPWRQVHDLLISAARSTHGVLPDPAPFVWQTALNDFFVTYEINAYIRAPRQMNDIYAELHSHIQDAFAAAGVEIMSPHFLAMRNGDAPALPGPVKPPA